MWSGLSAHLNAKESKVGFPAALSSQPLNKYLNIRQEIPKTRLQGRKMIPDDRLRGQEMEAEPAQ